MTGPHWQDGHLVVGGGAEPATLAVVPDGAVVAGGPLVPMAGTWSAAGDGVRFTPAFPPVPGAEYLLLQRLSSDLRHGDERGRDEQDLVGRGWGVRARAVAPGAPAAPATRVVAIDPDVEVVPENLMRFSITFSAPVHEGGAAGHLQLRGDGGAPLAGALLPMPPELWDRPRTRLTVLLDPGRLKRGLQPHVQAGPPLRVGTSVTLVVGAGILDARGAPLVAGAERSFRVGAPVRSRVDPTSWGVRWPQAPGDPVLVRFDRPLERALVLRCLRAVDGAGRPVPGVEVAGEGAATWGWTPSAGASGVAALHVHPDLEDVAGNSVGRVFDRDLRDREDDPVETSGVVLRPDGSVVARGPVSRAGAATAPAARG